MKLLGEMQYGTGVKIRGIGERYGVENSLENHGKLIHWERWFKWGE